MTIDEIAAEAKRDIWNAEHSGDVRTAVPRLARMLLAAIEAARQLEKRHNKSESEFVIRCIERATEGK